MRSDASKIILGALLVFGIVFLYTREVPFLQNTLDFKRLFLSAIGFGILVGTLLGYFFAKKRKDLLEQFQIFLASIFLSILLMPLLLSMSNRSLDFNTPIAETMELLRVESYAGSRFGRLAETKEHPDGYRIYLLREETVIRLQKKQAPFSAQQKGEEVVIPISQGLFGFEHVNWH